MVPAQRLYCIVQRVAAAPSMVQIGSVCSCQNLEESLRRSLGVKAVNRERRFKKRLKKSNRRLVRRLERACMPKWPAPAWGGPQNEVETEQFWRGRV